MANWGEDELTHFYDIANNEAQNTFTTLPTVHAGLVEIDKAFRHLLSHAVPLTDPAIPATKIGSGSHFHLKSGPDPNYAFLRCCRYIECNPIRARMVDDPAHYRWSSYRAHAVGAPDKLVSKHEQYERLGQDAEVRQTAYRELFRSELESKEIG